MDIMDKRTFLLQTVRQMKYILDDELMSVTLGKIEETIAHSAPEILNSRWKKIYLFCVQCVVDGGNEKHMQCYNLYHDKIQEYYRLYCEKGNV